MSGRGHFTASERAACIDGLPADTEAAIERAAALLIAARRVLVTGLADATLEEVQAACDLAELIGGAIDAGALDAASPAGPLLARGGGITADVEELRDRADLVIWWCCGPDAGPTGFQAAWLDPPLADGSRRQVIAVGAEPVPGGRQVSIPATAAVDAARLLQALLLRHRPPATATPLAAPCGDLAAAVREARCVAILTCREADPLGLIGWAVNLLVQTISHERPAFVIPLARPVAGGLDNAAGAAAVLAWRYGAAGAIARADRLGGDFRPAECSATALIDRGEVDAVVAVGRLSPAAEAAIAGRAADLAVVRIDDRGAELPGCAGPCVHLRATRAAGTILRADGRELTVGDPAAGDGPPSVALLAALRERLTREVPGD